MQEERKMCRKTLFFADIVEEDEIPPSEQEEIDMKLLISQSFALCSSQCCLAFAHVEDENEVQGEVTDILKSDKYPVIGKAEEKVDTDDEGAMMKSIHEKMVEDIGLKCISGVSNELHSHASTSPTHEAPFMTSTPYVSTMQVMYSMASSVDGDDLHNSEEEASDMFVDENVEEASLCLFSPIKDKVSDEGLVCVQSDSEAVTEIQNVKMVINENDHSDEILVEDLFKPFMDTTEDSPDPSNVCIEDVKTISVEEDKSVKTDNDQEECATESKLYIHLSY